MKSLIIICEGPTEQEFVKDLLMPHFLNFDIQVFYPLIKKSGGGIVKWDTLKIQIHSHLREGKSYVTTLIDYYGIPDRFNYPNWIESKAISNKLERLSFLEEAMSAEIDESLRYRFFPYYQLHEFEGLLFNNIKSFENTFQSKDFLDKNELERILSEFENPELIKDNPKSAPSKRLEKLINGYNKVVYGPMLAENIGIERIRAKAPRFNDWIKKLESI
jgi:hypothetical protein